MKAIIIDDDPYNIELIDFFCTKYAPAIHVIGKAETVEEGIEVVIKKKPDLLFLDGEIHEKTGFDILNAVNMPNLMVVMTTAHEKFGVQAAKVRVMDYLLKPISIKEFIKAVETCKTEFDKRSINTDGHLVSIYHRDHIELIQTSDILHLKADGNYTIITTMSDQQHIASKLLSYYESRLPSNDFIRVHNSHIVNVKGVSKLLRNKTISLLLINHTEVPISDSRKNEVLVRFLG